MSETNHENHDKLRTITGNSARIAAAGAAAAAVFGIGEAIHAAATTPDPYSGEYSATSTDPRFHEDRLASVQQIADGLNKAGAGTPIAIGLSLIAEAILAGRRRDEDDEPADHDNGLNLEEKI